MRAHLRHLTPLPRDELLALKRTISELGAIGRNINQIARAANQGDRVDGPSRAELFAILKACEGLRDHVRGLLMANLRSWAVGHDERKGQAVPAVCLSGRVDRLAVFGIGENVDRYGVSVYDFTDEAARHNPGSRRSSSSL